jgi:dsRNA-specific ribonuclease
LERLETIGDSFLKYATTVFLYHEHFNMHEGKLSFLRSKQVFINILIDFILINNRLAISHYIVWVNDVAWVMH